MDQRARTMATKFKARENVNYNKPGYTNKADSRYEVAEYEGRNLTGITGYSSASKEDVEARAAEMQADYDAALAKGWSDIQAYDFAHSGTVPTA